MPAGRGTWASSDDAEALRRRLDEGVPFEQALRDGGWRLALDALVPFAQIVTPSSEPRRFDTHFFLAELPARAEARPAEAESDQLVWAPVAQALSRGLTGEIVLLPPTWLMLMQLEPFDSAGAVLAWGGTARSSGSSRGSPQVRGPRSSRFRSPGRSFASPSRQTAAGAPPSVREGSSRIPSRRQGGTTIDISTLRVAVHTHAELGESPSWDAGAGVLRFVDAHPGTVYRYDPADGSLTSCTVGQPVGAVVVREAGGVVAATRDGIGLLDERTGGLELIAPIELDVPGSRMNDAKCDPAGRLWAGTMALDLTAGAGSLYRILRNHSFVRVVEEITCSNGLGWSPEGDRMYYIDTFARGVDVFDFEPETGDVSNRRRLVSFPPKTASPTAWPSTARATSGSCSSAVAASGGTRRTACSSIGSSCP